MNPLAVGNGEVRGMASRLGAMPGGRVGKQWIDETMYRPPLRLAVWSAERCGVGIYLGENAWPALPASHSFSCGLQSAARLTFSQRTWKRASCRPTCRGIERSCWSRAYSSCWVRRALLYRPTRRAAGIGLFALTILVTPANVYMLQQHDSFAIPLWILIARLPMQAALLAVIWWSTIKSAALTTGADVARAPDAGGAPPPG